MPRAKTISQKTAPKQPTPQKVAKSRKKSDPKTEEESTAVTKPSQSQRSQKAKIAEPQQPSPSTERKSALPKRPFSSYLCFSIQFAKLIREKEPGIKTPKVHQIVGQNWNNLSDDKKIPFVQKAA